VSLGSDGAAVQAPFDWANLSSSGQRSRNAHSLIEMLVVLIIVGVLVAIAVPAVQRSRESARMTQCTNHQGELAKALHMRVAADAYGRYPGYRAFAADGATVIGWAQQVFEFIGRKDQTQNPAQAGYIDVLVCPSDQGPRTSPLLSYVVNGGQAATDSVTDGLFFDHAKPEAQRVHISNEEITDGLGGTLMLAENIDATDWTVTDKTNQCILWPLTAGNEINRGVGPRPSSHHPGGFVATFADGSTKFVNANDINTDANLGTPASAYAVMLTPRGGEDAADVGGWPGNPSPDDPPCYDEGSGFVEIAEMFIWETNPYRCDASCNCTVRYYTSCDALDNPKLLLVPDTDHRYELAYYDARDAADYATANFVMTVERQGDGSIDLEATKAASFSFYTIYDGQPGGSGQPVSGMIDINEAMSYVCHEHGIPATASVAPGGPCNP
jgi:type II secretory pathway pseudopilin PulG